MPVTRQKGLALAPARSCLRMSHEHVGNRTEIVAPYAANTRAARANITALCRWPLMANGLVPLTSHGHVHYRRSTVVQCHVHVMWCITTVWWLWLPSVSSHGSEPRHGHHADLTCLILFVGVGPLPVPEAQHRDAQPRQVLSRASNPALPPDRKLTHSLCGTAQSPAWHWHNHQTHGIRSNASTGEGAGGHPPVN